MRLSHWTHFDRLQTKWNCFSIRFFFFFAFADWIFIAHFYATWYFFVGVCVSAHKCKLSSTTFFILSIFIGSIVDANMIVRSLLLLLLKFEDIVTIAQHVLTMAVHAICTLTLTQSFAHSLAHRKESERGKKFRKKKCKLQPLKIGWHKRALLRSMLVCLCMCVIPRECLCSYEKRNASTRFCCHRKANKIKTQKNEKMVERREVFSKPKPKRRRDYYCYTLHSWAALACLHWIHIFVVAVLLRSMSPRERQKKRKKKYEKF